MKKKIAVLVNGWNNYSVTQAIKGIRSCIKDKDVDIFVFLSFAAYSQTKERNYGEDSIFDLPDYSEFDGVIIFSIMLNSFETPERIGKVLVEKNVKAVSIGMELPGIDYVGIENKKGMYEMVEHLVKEHHIKNPVFLAGPKQNVDSNQRLESTRRALEDNGIILSDDSIRYTDWEYELSMKYAQEFAQSNNKPDAYICANDNIAIAACIGLQRLGMSIPKDAVVTGFDRLSFAQTFYPSITTVFQDYEKIGYTSAAHLLDLIEGESKTDRIEVSSEFLRNESCGCKKSEEGEVIRHQFCCDAYSNEMENILFQVHTSNITKALFDSSDFSTFQQKLIAYLKSKHTFEGDNFKLILTDSTMKAFKHSSFPLKKVYSKTMHCIVSIDNGEFTQYEPFDRRHLVPGYNPEGKPDVYTICSLHFDDNLFGYIVLGDMMKQINDTTLNHYLLQLNSNLEKYRQNARLDEMNRTLRSISQKDPLTGLYNRFGLEQVALPMFEKAHKDGKACVIMFADINRMKYINDEFGHLQGDLAIRTVASSILNKIPENWLGIRYGGDEFLTLGVSDDHEYTRSLLEEINNSLEKQVRTMHLSYPLSISLGYIITDPKSNKSLIDFINEADSIMYENKQKTYEKENYKRK